MKVHVGGDFRKFVENEIRHAHFDVKTVLSSMGQAYGTTVKTLVGTSITHTGVPRLQS